MFRVLRVDSMGLVSALKLRRSIISAITKYASSSFSKQQGYQGSLADMKRWFLTRETSPHLPIKFIIEQFEAINEETPRQLERPLKLSNPSARVW